MLGGGEPINWAYITKSGKSQAPANPLFTGTLTDPNFKAVNPNLAKDLLMSPGDRIRIHMHDTPAGFQVNLTDLTTGKSGSMTASIANGFGHILYTPNSKTCQEAPYAFHPEYSTANVRGNVWTAHTYNVAMSDEIGHFENCLTINANGTAPRPGGQDPSRPDADDSSCVPGTDSTVVKIDGCFAADDRILTGSPTAWTGRARTRTSPWTGPCTRTPVMFTSPTTNGRNYSVAEFETDLPAIEIKGVQFNPPFCNPNTGAHCVNPPSGAQFYPFFSTTKRNGACLWQEGGKFLPGTIRDFGGSSTAEFGSLLKLVFPVPGFKTVKQINDFNSGSMKNPCLAR